MFGTAVEQLERSVKVVSTAVRSAQDVDLSRNEAVDALLRLERVRERLEAAVGSLVSDLEARGVHERDHSYSMANWLAGRTGQRRSTAGSRVHLARKLRTMPLTGAAFGAGEITASHASVLARALNARTAEAFARDEGVLVGSAKRLSADQLVHVVEFWLRHNDPDGPEPNPEDRDRFWMSQTLDGRLKGDFDLGGDLAVTVKATIDELVSLWSCDCWIAHVIVRRGDGQPLDAGREIRVANRAMRRALVARDGACCAVPGCDRPVGWCDAHHIVWWELGGHTALDNLVFLCRWHHRWVHAGHLRVAMVDGRPQFTNRDGVVLVEPGGGPDPPGDPPSGPGFSRRFASPRLPS